jgi:hypothetical protein
MGLYLGPMLKPKKKGYQIGYKPKLLKIGPIVCKKMGLYLGPMLKKKWLPDRVQTGTGQYPGPDSPFQFFKTKNWGTPVPVPILAKNRTGLTLLL